MGAFGGCCGTMTEKALSSLAVGEGGVVSKIGGTAG